jgi:hypothetical protein
VVKCSALLSRWQGDVHDREVEDDHQLRDTDHGQDQPASSAQIAGNRGGI